MPIAPFVPPARGAAAPAQPLQPPPAHNGQAFWLKVSAKEDGSFTVTNARNGFVKTYAGFLVRPGSLALDPEPPRPAWTW